MPRNDASSTIPHSSPIVESETPKVVFQIQKKLLSPHYVRFSSTYSNKKEQFQANTTKYVEEIHKEDSTLPLTDDICLEYVEYNVREKKTECGISDQASNPGISHATSSSDPPFSFHSLLQDCFSASDSDDNSPTKSNTVKNNVTRLNDNYAESPKSLSETMPVLILESVDHLSDSSEISFGTIPVLASDSLANSPRKYSVANDCEEILSQSPLTFTLEIDTSECIVLEDKKENTPQETSSSGRVPIIKEAPSPNHGSTSQVKVEKINKNGKGSGKRKIGKVAHQAVMKKIRKKKSTDLQCSEPVKVPRNSKNCPSVAEPISIGSKKRSKAIQKSPLKRGMKTSTLKRRSEASSKKQLIPTGSVCGSRNTTDKGESRSSKRRNTESSGNIEHVSRLSTDNKTSHNKLSKRSETKEGHKELSTVGDKAVHAISDCKSSNRCKKNGKSFKESNKKGTDRTSKTNQRIALENLEHRLDIGRAKMKGHKDAVPIRGPRSEMVLTSELPSTSSREIHRGRDKGSIHKELKVHLERIDASERLSSGRTLQRRKQRSSFQNEAYRDTYIRIPRSRRFWEISKCINRRDVFLSIWKDDEFSVESFFTMVSSRIPCANFLKNVTFYDDFSKCLCALNYDSTFVDSSWFSNSQIHPLQRTPLSVQECIATDSFYDKAIMEMDAASIFAVLDLNFSLAFSGRVIRFLMYLCTKRVTSVIDDQATLPTSSLKEEIKKIHRYFKLLYLAIQLVRQNTIQKQASSFGRKRCPVAVRVRK